MQAHFEIIQEVSHGVVEEIELVNVLLIDQGTFDFARILTVFCCPLVENSLRFGDFTVEDSDMFA